MRAHESLASLPTCPNVTYITLSTVWYQGLFPPTASHSVSFLIMVSLTSTFDLLVLVFSFAAFLAIRDYRRRRGLPYPPGPRPIPLIGNLFDIPKEFSWLEYTQMSKKYGVDSSPCNATADQMDDRGCPMPPRLWPSHRHTEFGQGNQRPARETR